MIAAISTDGFIAGPNGDKSWISDEDKEFLRQTIKKSDVLIMGSGTFLAHKDSFNLKSTKKRIVLTSRPSDYKEYRHLASFVSKDITKILQQLKESGHKKALILGGSRLYADCLEGGLVDEVLLTVEPVLLSKGTPFLSGGKSMNNYPNFKQLSTVNLNEKGALIHSFLLKS